ncbi:uncharacterized protein RJT20DRAFT_29051 [Scheffersomyces xylosifermentans]|uniref:uncharacterized protein n=1 Tax=Scheffersomyces xylosifermentans TaxID=1304137 RepID=UPI00315C7CAC
MFRGVLRSPRNFRSQVWSGNYISVAFQSQITAKAVTGRGRRKSIDTPHPLSKDIQESPNDFCAVHTQYGWYTLPLQYYGNEWTVSHITDLIREKFPDIDKSPKDKNEVQKAVDEWLHSVDISAIPKAHKKTKREEESIKKDELYRKQLKVEVDGRTVKALKDKGTKDRKKKSEKDDSLAHTVTYTQTWNYYFSLKYANSDEPYLIARKKIAQTWGALSPATKEKYRLEYAQLLSEGKDIYKGKIISIEEKQKKNSSFAKYKKTLKTKEQERKQKLLELAELED